MGGNYPIAWSDFNWNTISSSLQQNSEMIITNWNKFIDNEGSENQALWGIREISEYVNLQKRRMKGDNDGLSHRRKSGFTALEDENL